MITTPHAETAQSNGSGAAQVTAPPHVVIASTDSRVSRSLGDALGDHCRLSTASSIAEVIGHLADGPRPIVITTEQLRDGDAATLQSKLEESDLRIGDGIKTVSMLVTDRQRSGLDSAQLDSFFYVMSPRLEPSSVLALVRRAAMLPRAIAGVDAVARSLTHARMTFDIIAYTRRLAAESSLRGAARAAVDIIGDLLGTVRAYCLYHDQDSGALWSETTRHVGSEEEDASSSRGLAGYVAKTQRSVAVPRLSRDPRFDPAIDDPSAVGNERGIFHPIVGTDGVVHVVLIAIGDANGPAFADRSRRTMFELAKHWTPIFQSHALQHEVEEELEESEGGGNMPFRQEALDEYNNPQEQGETVRIIPPWIGSVYWVLLSLVIAAGIAASIIKIGRYARGEAIITFEGATEVAARIPGVISTVHVRPGQRVQSGQLLLSFDAEQEKQNLRRLDAEYHVAAANWLENPTVEETSAQLARTRAERHAATERLAEREIRAPRSGILGRLRVESGRPVAVGDVLFSIADEDSDPIVLAFLPGNERPHLTSNLPIRVRLVGEEFPSQNVVLDHVSDDVMTPADLARLVGPGLVETLKIQPSMVLARARLPSREIKLRSKTVVIHSGMRAEVQVKTREESLISMLLDLKNLL